MLSHEIVFTRLQRCQKRKREANATKNSTEICLTLTFLNYTPSKWISSVWSMSPRATCPSISWQISWELHYGVRLSAPLAKRGWPLVPFTSKLMRSVLVRKSSWITAPTSHSHRPWSRNSTPTISSPQWLSLENRCSKYLKRPLSANTPSLKV